MYELVIRCDEDGVVIEPRGRLDDDADRHIDECVAAARETGVTPRVRMTAGGPAAQRPWGGTPAAPG